MDRWAPGSVQTACFSVVLLWPAVAIMAMTGVMSHALNSQITT